MNIVEENIKRNEKLFPKYNAVTGVGSWEERFEIKLDNEISLYLPVEMLQLGKINDVYKAGGLHKYSVDKKLLKEYDLTEEDWKVDFVEELQKLRLKYDFEYWAYACGRIHNKETRKLIRFYLRPAQRKLLHSLEKMRKAGEPMRVIVLKARQWGGSTLTQLYMMWIQIYWRSNWNSAIAAKYKSQATIIKSMYERAIANYPKEEYHLKNVGGSSNVKEIVETGSQISIGSMQSPDALRSGDYSMAHYSEIGLWEQTEKLKPEDLIASISGSITSEPYTLIVMESTAKGEGNYFHKEWIKAINKESEFVPVFVAWWEIELYRKEFKSTKDLTEFYNNLDSYGQYLWSLGATLEGINWYFSHKRKQSLSEWQMHEEYPSTPEEAFISSGERVIPVEYTLNLRQMVKEPVFRGEITADAQKGESALQNIKFESLPNGNLSIWQYPDDKIKYNNRYVVSMDIGGTSKRSDFTVIRVLDRLDRMNGGGDTFVATWRGHMDVDLVVWKAAQLSKIYCDALLVVESNTIDSRHQYVEEGNSYTVFDEIVGEYDNLYVRTDPTRIKMGLPPKFGFFTSEDTKSALVVNLKALLRENRFIDYDVNMLSEINTYEYDEKRKMNAKQGSHDDVIMASMIALYVSEKEMETPKKQDDKSYYVVPSFI